MNIYCQPSGCQAIPHALGNISQISQISQISLHLQGLHVISNKSYFKILMDKDSQVIIKTRSSFHKISLVSPVRYNTIKIFTCINLVNSLYKEHPQSILGVLTLMATSLTILII